MRIAKRKTSIYKIEIFVFKPLTNILFKMGMTILTRILAKKAAISIINKPSVI